MKTNLHFLGGETEPGSGQASPLLTSKFAPQTPEMPPNEIEKMSSAIFQADSATNPSAGSEQSLATEKQPCHVPDSNGRVAWREALQGMARRAVANGMSEQDLETQLASCVKFLQNCGCDFGQGVDLEFISRVSEAVVHGSATQVPGLSPFEVPPSLKGLLRDLVCAHAECHNRQHQKTTVPVAESAAVEPPLVLQPTPSPVELPLAEATPDALHPGLPISYDALSFEHKKGRPNVETKTAQNEISALHRLMNILGENGTADCRWMADQRKFEEALTRCNIADRSFRSAVNQVRKTLFSLMALANPTNTLWESYLRAHHNHVQTGGKVMLMMKNEFILHCFHATGMSRRRLNAAKIMVHGETFERVRALELSLEADGELTSWLINMSDNNAQKYKTEYGKRLSEAVLFQYSLVWEEWTSDLKAEWNDLYLLRTEPLKASRKWHLHLEQVPKKKLFTWKIRKNDGSCASAKKQRRELECFYGWCLLPQVILPDGTKNLYRSGPDKPITKEQLSLALLADQDLFDGYITFRKAHTLTEAESIAGQQPRFNRSCKLFIEFTSSLLNRLTGFIYLRKDLYFRPDDKTPSPRNLAHRVGTEFYDFELAKRIQVTDLDERWRLFCKEIRSYMEQTREQEFDPSYQTRGKAPVRPILDLDDPMDAIVYLLGELEKSEPVIDYWKHFHRRKQLFFKCISVCPLRIFQYAFMSGFHLYKVEAAGGRRVFYQIHFDKEEFKNERFIREQDYYFNLPADYTAFIDDYLANDWPALNGRPFTRKDHIFSTGGRDDAKHLSAKQINESIKSQLMKICKETTARHLGGKYKTPGFYSHVMRDVKATSIIKVTGSYEQAALLLWDAVETVRRAYSHVKRVDQLARASQDDYARMKAAMAKLA